MNNTIVFEHSFWFFFICIALAFGYAFLLYFRDKKFRITSYNVCYTKLLRIGNQGGITDRELKKLFLQAFFKLDYSEIKNMSFSQVRELANSQNVNSKITATKYLFRNEISNDDEIICTLLDSKDRSVKLARITSYNVCYTKLLRFRHTDR